MPNELLIEVGLEELPASFLKQALSSNEAAAHQLLETKGATGKVLLAW